MHLTPLFSTLTFDKRSEGRFVSLPHNGMKVREEEGLKATLFQKIKVDQKFDRQPQCSVER